MFRQLSRRRERMGIASTTEMERLRNIEKQIAKMRWPTIIIPLLLMPFILQGRLLTYGFIVLIIDLGYNAVFTVLLQKAPLRITPWLSWSSIIVDTLFLTFLIIVTDGFESPYFIAYYAIAIAVSMRFGILSNILSALISAVSYALAITYTNGIGVWAYAMGDYATRMIFLVMVSLIVGYLSEERLSMDTTNRALQAAIRRLTAGNEISQALNFPANLRLALEQAVAKVAEIPNVPQSQLLLIAGQVALPSAEEARSQETRLVQISSEELARQYPAGHQALTENRAVLTSEPNHPEDGGQKCLFVPVSTRERRFGVLMLWASEPTYGILTDELAQLVSIGTQMATTIENARLYEETQRHLVELEEANRQLREAQEQLIQTEKLAAIGQLAAGVAHEINNPMAVILGFAQTLLQHYATDELLRHPLETIESEALRCKRIVQNLLTFSRRREPERRPTDLNETMQASLQLLRHQAYLGNIQIVEEWKENLPLIQADTHQLQQVFVNLMLNAVQAMPNGGTLTLRTWTEEGVVVGQVADTGTGIAEDVLPHIFDPFFTTKEVGKGTGLGLSVSYGIVERHGGTIRAESEKEKGSSFLVVLPCTDEQNIITAGNPKSN